MGPDIVPVWSVDGEHWSPVPSVAWDDRAKEATIRLRPESDAIWIAHQPPYTPRRLARLLEEIDRSRLRPRRGHRQDGPRARPAPGHDHRPGRPRPRQEVRLAPGEAARVGVGHVVRDGGGAPVRGVGRAVGARAAAQGRLQVHADGRPRRAAPRARSGSTPTAIDVNRHWDEVDLRDKRSLARMPEIWYVKKSIYAPRRFGPEDRPAAQPAQHGDGRVSPDDGRRRGVAAARRDAERPARSRRPASARAEAPSSPPRATGRPTCSTPSGASPSC